MEKKPVVFSGIQPTGNIHIGNYLGAIAHWVDAQDQFKNIFCIVDLHAITVPQNPETLRAKTREVAGILLAAGIDPNRSVLFVQSHIGAHSELAWILNTLIPMGWMERMTQFKEKSAAQKERVSVGLFDYPALMAADILLYHTNRVPVGEDQRQHVELARDVAERFNAKFKPVFTIPEAEVPAAGARIMGLDDPTKKMSKSDRSSGHAINVLDTPDAIRDKIARATTDSENSVRFDKLRPGIYNLLVIYEQFTGEARDAIEKKFEQSGYAELKSALAEAIIDRFNPLQERYKEIAADPEAIDRIFDAGAATIRPTAEKTLRSVQDAMGLG